MLNSRLSGSSVEDCAQSTTRWPSVESARLRNGCRCLNLHQPGRALQDRAAGACREVGQSIQGRKEARRRAGHRVQLRLRLVDGSGWTGQTVPGRCPEERGEGERERGRGMAWHDVKVVVGGRPSKIYEGWMDGWMPASKCWLGICACTSRKGRGYRSPLRRRVDLCLVFRTSDKGGASLAWEGDPCPRNDLLNGWSRVCSIFVSDLSGVGSLVSVWIIRKLPWDCTNEIQELQSQIIILKKIQFVSSTLSLQLSKINEPTPFPTPP